MAAVFTHHDAGLKVTEANNRFALDLFKTCSKNVEENVFLSPFSISVALAMTYGGAAGSTKEEMQKSLHLTDTDDQLVHGTFLDIQTALKKSNSNITLHLANKLFAENSYKFLPEFIEFSQKYYEAEQQNLDFVNDATGAQKLINQWVEEKTQNKIKDIIPSGALNSLTRLVLVNAIYFKGDWMNKFDKEKTKDGDFLSSSGTKFTVPFMFKKHKFMIGRSDDLECEFLEIPYSSKALSMYIYLPFVNSNVSNLENKLKFEHFVDAHSVFKVHEREVHLYVPRFRLESSFKLNDVLSLLGITHLFNPSSADLSKVDGTRNLFVSSVLHKAFIDVNEEGSEAAAATAVVMMLRSAPMITEFRVNRPFVFLIKDNSTNSVLFIGKFMKPSGTANKDEL